MKKRFRAAVPLALTIATLELLHQWLKIPSRPLEIHNGWRCLVAWGLLFSILNFSFARFFEWCLSWFEPKIEQGKDPYTQTLAEIAAERRVKGNNMENL